MKKQNMKKNKIICLLISLFASFVLWSYVVTVINTEQTETIYNIPVTFIGTDILREQNLIIIRRRRCNDQSARHRQKKCGAAAESG